MKKPKALHNFYKSNEWQLARQIKITQVNGKCERCGKPGQEVHHIRRLNVNNIKDVSVSLDQNNLEFLCKDCHNKEHKRFSSKQLFDSEGNLIPN